MTATTTTTPLLARPQSLSFYHPSTGGSGAALQLEPRFNRLEPDRYNCFFLELAAQKTAPRQEEGKRVHATFDWEHKLTVKLDFPDLCELLTVLEGRADKVGGSRNGLYHQTGKAVTIITFQKAEKGGYFLGLSRKETESGQLRRVGLTLTEAEALGLRCVFQTGLFFLSFAQHLFATWEGGRN